MSETLKTYQRCHTLLQKIHEMVSLSCLVTIGLHDYTYGERKALGQNEGLLCLRQAPISRDGE